MKKKLLAVATVVSLCVSMLTGCGSSAVSVEGKWVPYAMEWQNEKKTFDELVEMSKEDGSEAAAQQGMSMLEGMYYEFKDGGEFEAGVAGQTAEGKWEETDAGVEIDVNGTKTTLQLEDGELVIENAGQTVYFEKE